MFNGIYPDIFQMVGKIVVISYPEVQESCLPDGGTLLVFQNLFHQIGFYTADNFFDHNARIRHDHSVPMIR